MHTSSNVASSVEFSDWTKRKSTSKCQRKKFAGLNRKWEQPIQSWQGHYGENGLLQLQLQVEETSNKKHRVVGERSDGVTAWRSNSGKKAA